MRKLRRQRLLGDGLLGRGDRSRFIGPPYYLVNDTFTTNRSAGAVNGTKAEPGPGKRTVTDGNSKLSLSGGAAVIATGGATAGDPGLYYGGIARVAGLIVTAQITPSTNNAQAGWETNASGSIGHGWRFAGSNTLQAFVNGSPLTVGTWAANAQNMAIAARASGCYFFLKPNGGNWLLMWLSTAGSQATLLPAVIAETSTGVISCDYIRVPAVRWLPAPLASDGFNIWGTTDGQGHAEGVAGGVGAGGLGRLWTQQVGSWSVSGGAAAATLSGGRAIATVDTSKADVIVTAKLTGGANSAAILARYVTESDYVELRHTGTNVQLVKVVSTVNTTLINQAVTFVAGAEIRLIAEGQKFKAYYNGALVGTEQTIADASLASGTKVGLRSANASNTFDDFAVYARGSGGEYAILDNAAPSLTADYLFVIGDSKSTDTWNTAPTWVTKLMAELGARTGKSFREIQPRFAISGYTMAAMKAYVDTNLAAVTGTPSKIVINVGVNDISTGVTPNETTWKANLTSIIDSLRAKWASADIYVAKPWRQGLDSEAATTAGYIDTVIATYGSHVFVGHNESVWVKGSDNGAAMLQDSVHYSTLAQTIAAAQWLAAMGY